MPSNGVWDFTVELRYKPVIDMLVELGNEGARYKVPLHKFALEYIQEVRDRFSRQAFTSRSKWAPLSPDYQADKGSRAMLVLTGKMKRAFTNPGSAIMHIDDESVTIGSDKIPDAMAMNWGRPKSGRRRGENRLPTRSFMGWDDDIRDRLIELLREHQNMIMGQLARKYQTGGSPVG